MPAAEHLGADPPEHIEREPFGRGAESAPSYHDHPCAPGKGSPHDGHLHAGQPPDVRRRT